jgi:hypothetical protein
MRAMSKAAVPASRVPPSRERTPRWVAFAPGSRSYLA